MTANFLLRLAAPLAMAGLLADAALARIGR
jgi:hypothetical protein